MNEELILQLYHSQNHYDSTVRDTENITASNASCGDDVSLSLQIRGEKIAKATFSGSACSITQASAEFMCRAIEGRMLSEISAETLQQECLVAFDLLKKERRVLCAILPYQALAKVKLETEDI